ncbi:hypothetical protein Nepgr_022882 [Nepenthes gracilis]|uniref:Uncharacterized protein n=1 Tax=Nepenthes gracilis TaxID=150966 RepID=A0AAD3T1H3_NEPGR|nr:hypothetical protein Nepgr_022882 [Nepenthes gracilis]
MPPIDEFGNSGQFPCSVAEEALPQPESLPAPIDVLNTEPLFGPEIETPALPSTESLALSNPNSPLPGPVPQAIMDLGDTRSVTQDALPSILTLFWYAACAAGAPIFSEIGGLQLVNKLDGSCWFLSLWVAIHWRRQDVAVGPCFFLDELELSCCLMGWGYC